MCEQECKIKASKREEKRERETSLEESLMEKWGTQTMIPLGLCFNVQD